MYIHHLSILTTLASVRCLKQNYFSYIGSLWQLKYILSKLVYYPWELFSCYAQHSHIQHSAFLSTCTYCHQQSHITVLYTCALMSLLIWYQCIPLYVCLHIISYLSWIPQPHNVPVQHPVWHPWVFVMTSFVYGMYRWPMDHTVIFSFLDWSPHCFSDDYFFFQLTDWPPWYMTVLLSYLTCPDVDQPVSSHCATWSVSQGTVAISLWIILVLIFPWQVFCI